MNLTLFERWTLVNQYRILEKLYPDEADGMQQIRVALESGYEGAYTWDNPIDTEVLSGEECSEVIAILDMFMMLHFSFKNLEDKSGIDKKDLQYRGFDGNNEKQYSFAGWLRAQGKWQQLNPESYVNSHIPIMSTYRKMLLLWEQSDDPNNLTKEDIIRIIS